MLALSTIGDDDSLESLSLSLLSLESLDSESELEEDEITCLGYCFGIKGALAGILLIGAGL